MTKNMNLREGVIFGLCNPLLDVSATVEKDLLEKYKLKENFASLGNDQNFSIYEELEKNYLIEYIAGGSCQNTLRCTSWILNFKNVATFMGCVGRDKYAEIMEEKARASGLNVVYQYQNQYPTGKCAALISGKHRTLLAHLDAANEFTIDHLEDPKNWSYIEKADIFYVSGFFLTVCPKAVLKIAEYSNNNNKVFIMNLGAPFVCENYKEQLMQILPYVNILFGNNDEASAFEKHVLKDSTNDIQMIANKISNIENKTQRKRIAIITQGAEPVIMVSDNIIKTFPITKIDNNKIVDTNGAGDSFVGGFLAQYVKGENIEKCIHCGIWASSIVIQQSGCTFPEKMTYV